MSPMGQMLSLPPLGARSRESVCDQVCACKHIMHAASMRCTHRNAHTRVHVCMCVHMRVCVCMLGGAGHSGSTRAGTSTTGRPFGPGEAFSASPLPPVLR